MNGARTTFMRRGYLLTALAAVVLLAASPGTASAQRQSVEFSVTSGVVTEGVAANNRNAFSVVITRSGVDAETPFDGAVSLRTSATTLGTTDGQFQMYLTDGTTTVGTGVANPLTFVRDEVELIIVQAEDNDWEDETLTIELEVPVGTDPGPRLVLTADDNEDQPVVAFDPSQLDLYENNSATVDVTVAAADAMKNPGAAIDTLLSVCGADGATLCQLQVMVDPPDAVSMDDTAPVTIAASGTTTGVAAVPMMPGMFTIGANLASLGGGDGTDMGTVMFSANPVSEGFRDRVITVTPVEASLATPSGAVGAGSPLVITVTSNKEVPVVTIVPTSLSVDEGESTTFAIVAEGTFGDEVMDVMLSMKGDAMVTLWQGTDEIMADDMGMYTVALGSSSNARVTVMAESDRGLETGMTKEATFTIEDAGGATIGDDNWVTITVNGNTAVPAIPLIGQLLLALFLMAGGARFYRRRG